MPQSKGGKSPTPKPNEQTNVREPDNTRPPREPTPDKPMRPESKAADPDIQTEGM